MTSNQSDFETVRTLVEHAKSGDESALSELYARYAPLIDSTCSRHLRTAPSEEELRSEIISVFWEAVKTYDLGQTAVTFGHYTQVCTHNRLASCGRKWKRMPSPLPLEDARISEQGADDENNPAHYLAERERYLDLLGKIERLLSDRERAVWLLFIDGQTPSEIAEHLGISKKDVENAIFRARKKLRQHISPHTL
jgi:RNA polymerase sigma-70 factor (ECF subfamily)